MKSVKGVTRDCRKVFNTLNTLSEEVGAFGVKAAWKYHDGLRLQCHKEKLREFAERNDLDYKVVDGELIVEIFEITLFAI